MMNIEPLGIHVLVEPIEATGSMVIPELNKGAPERGIVRGVGPKVESALKDGDRIIFRKYAQEEFELDGRTVFLIEEADCMGREYD